jgi:hypothetical protein
MTGWLIALILLIGFFAWAGWVLRKRSPNRPGATTLRDVTWAAWGAGAPADRSRAPPAVRESRAWVS